MGPDREMAEVETDVSRGGGSGRVEEGGDRRRGAKALWEAGTDGHYALSLTPDMGQVHLCS